MKKINFLLFFAILGSVFEAYPRRRAVIIRDNQYTEMANGEARDTKSCDKSFLGFTWYNKTATTQSKAGVIKNKNNYKFYWPAKAFLTAAITIPIAVFAYKYCK